MGDPYDFAGTHLGSVVERVVLYCNAAWGSEELKIVGPMAYVRYRGLLRSYEKLLEDHDYSVPSWKDRESVPDKVPESAEGWSWVDLEEDLEFVTRLINRVLATYRVELAKGPRLDRNVRRALNRVLYAFTNEYATLAHLWDQAVGSERVHTHDDLMEGGR